MGRLTGYERSILRLLLAAIRPARGPLHRVLRQRLTAVPCTLQAGSVCLAGWLARSQGTGSACRSSASSVVSPHTALATEYYNTGPVTPE